MRILINDKAVDELTPKVVKSLMPTSVVLSGAKDLTERPKILLPA
jgi:hypothetical protein